MQRSIPKLLLFSLLFLISISCKDDDALTVQTFELASTNNNNEVIAAMEHAFSIWDSHLEIDVPIKVNVVFTPISFGFLGRSIPNGRKDFDGAQFEGIWYPSALANQIANTELNEGEFDVDILMDGTRDWYFGTDGNPGPNQFDFVSVFLHEVCHALGFGSLADIIDGRGTWSVNFESELYTPSFLIPDLENRPTVYDLFLENGNLFQLADEERFGNPSFTLTNEFVSNNLFWGGNIAQSVNNNRRPQVYAPSIFQPGSSLSHLDEDAFESGTSNAMMTPTFQEGEVIHEPGPIILGVLQDMGWTLKD